MVERSLSTWAFVQSILKSNDWERKAAPVGFSQDMHFLTFPYFIWRETTNDFFFPISCSSKKIASYTVTEGLGTK